jgi:hypothetical protein
MLWRLQHHHNVQLHIAFRNMPLPRKPDQVVMDLLMMNKQTLSKMEGLIRCRIYLGVIFLSGMTTADGMYLEQYVFERVEDSTKSYFKFSREKPTPSNWD